MVKTKVEDENLKLEKPLKLDFPPLERLEGISKEETYMAETTRDPYIELQREAFDDSDELPFEDLDDDL